MVTCDLTMIDAHDMAWIKHYGYDRGTELTHENELFSTIRYRYFAYFEVSGYHMIQYFGLSLDSNVLMEYIS